MRPARSLRSSWRRAGSLWRDLQGRRRTATTATGLLRPGIYRPLSETLWARRGARIPVHLLRTKGGSPSGSAEVSMPYRLLRLVAGTFPVLGARRGRTAELVVVSFDGGIVVLDQAGGKVHRTYGTGPLTPADEDRRRQFIEHVSAPQFRFHSDGAVIEEELVEGDYLGDLAHEERVGLITTLVEQCATLTAAYSSDAPSVTDRDLEALLHEVDVPPGFARAWGRSSTQWFSPRTPWIPTPREANAKNIVVRPDGRPAPIDLGDLQVDPYFIYPVGILIAAGSTVMRRFLSGDLDRSFALLLAAAGHSWGGTPQERRGLLLARIAYAGHKDSLVEGVVDRTIFSASLLRRWEEVRDVFDDIPAHRAPAPPERR
ncbi:MAG: hypothetical protein L0H93_10270 [Nocardioides sp.]|nr:hypothetical protein [Nocardioides sp.]